MLLKEVREDERRRRIYDAADQLEMDPEIAAANIQVILEGEGTFGYVARAETGSSENSCLGHNKKSQRSYSGALYRSGSMF